MDRFGRLKLAFFDIDGTLIRRIPNASMGLKSQSFNHGINKTFGLQVNYMDILGKKIFGMTDRSIAKFTVMESGVDESTYYSKEPEMFAAINDFFEKSTANIKDPEYYPITGIREFIERLMNNNIRLGLVTGNIRKHADWKMATTGFGGVFTTGAYGDDAEGRHDIMLAALKRNHDIDREFVCHFGDSPADLLAAKTCGIKSVAITDLGGGTHTRGELETAGYGLIIDSWQDSAKIVKYLES